MKNFLIGSLISFRSVAGFALSERTVQRQKVIGKWIVILLLGFFAGNSHAQTLIGRFPEAGGAISVTANGGDVAAAGLDFLSASGSLIPAPGPGTDASPFTFFLSNTANQVTYGNLGSNVTFADGSTTALSVGARAGAVDIFAAWGDGPQPVAFDVFAEGASLGLTDDLRFVLRGTAAQVEGLWLNSVGSSLVPATDPSPFQNLLTNEPAAIEYAGGPVMVDGELILNSSWNRNIGIRDVTYRIGETPGRLVSTDEYPPQAPIGNIRVSIDTDNGFVLSGDGNELREVRFRSPSRSLLPATTAAPFSDFGRNDSEQVDLLASEFVTLAGDLKLTAGYNTQVAGEDVTVRTHEVGSRFGFTQRINSYPKAAPPVQLTLDKEDRFVLRGNGEKLLGVQFQSDSGSLVPSDAEQSFPITLSNTSSLATYGILGSENAVALDGEVRLASGWNSAGAADVEYSYGISGAIIGPISLFKDPASVPNSVGISLNDGLRWVLNGTGQKLEDFRLHSAGGGLVPAATAEPFSSLVSNDMHSVYFKSNGVVSIDGSLTIGAGWDYDSGHRDVAYDYVEEGRDLRSTPLKVPSSVYRQPAPITLGLDENNRFVMRGVGQVVGSLAISSGGPFVPGSLVPAESPEPFAAFGENSKSNVELSGPPIRIDGEVTLAAGWDPIVGIRDVTYTFGGQDERAVVGDEYPARAPTRNITASINENDNFVLTGNGNQLRRVAIRSLSRSIVTSDSPAPFSEFNLNESNSINMISSSFVTLDGDLTLTAGYNRRIGGKDVTFQFQEVGDPGLSFFTRVQDYPDALPPIQVALDRGNRFVLTGQGEELLGLEFTSESGSLVLGNTNDPFQITLQNTPNQLTYGVLGAENAVKLDGSIAMASGWNPLGSPDVEYSYGLIGGGLVGPTPLFQAPPAELDVVRVSLNNDFRWVLNGTGEKLEQFDLFSERGGLIPADVAGPFQALTLNDENSIRFETDGNVTVDGSVTLAAGWSFDLGIRDIRYWYREEGSDLNAGPYVVPTSVYPPPPASGRVAVSIDDNDRKFVLQGEGHLLRTFAFDSPSGSLVPAESSAPFESFGENSKTRVAYEIPSHVQLDGTLKLNSGYDIDVAGEDVSYRYQQLGHASPRGPFEIAQSEYPPNPRKSPLRISIDNDLNFVVSGIGQPVTNLTFGSVGGSLESADSPDPFDEFATDTPEQVALSSLGLVRIDGTLVLPVKWNETSADVEFVYSLEGSNEEIGPTRLRGSDYPSPNVINVAVSQTGGSIAFFGNGQLISGFEVRSESGALDHRDVGGDYLPFETATDLTANFGRFTTEEPIAADWIRLPFLKWDENSDADIEVTFIGATGSTRAIVTQIDYVAPVVPEPNGFALMGLAGLAFVRLVRKKRNVAAK